MLGRRSCIFQIFPKVPGSSRQFDILNNSHETGTPLNSSDGEEDDDRNSEEEFLKDLENEMNKFGDDIDLLRETDIRSLLSGEKGQPILQLYNFKKVEKAKCFKADAHGGKVPTTKITFSANVNEGVEAAGVNIKLHKTAKPFPNVNF